MRLLLKQNIMKILDLMGHVQESVLEQWKTLNKERLLEQLTQLQEAAMEIGNAVEAQAEFDESFIRSLEEYCELLYQLSQAMDDPVMSSTLLQACGRKLSEIRRQAKETSVEIKIAFFPYKYSMWDSLESIWKAALQDDRCECQVVSVPYYDRKENMELGRLHDERDSYPEEVHALDYRQYDLEEENPDIIYIHNPYDEYNRVTCIEPAYFMENLKKQGAVLIYVPYYMASCCTKFEAVGTGYRTKGAVLSDYVVLQSHKLKTAYEYSGIDGKKILVTGSPKIDKINELKERKVRGKQQWQAKLEGKKVFLLCSSVNDLLTYDNWLCSTNAAIDRILRDKSLALIWRPHPLMLQTMQTMKRDYVEEYKKIYERVQKAENGIVDESGEFGDALTASDGMIGDFSSLVLQYIFMEKPVLLLRGSSEGRKGEVFCDFFSSYFVSEGTTVDDFVEMIKEGRDEKKEERMRFARASVVNADGTCGKKTHEAVLKEISFWE